MWRHSTYLYNLENGIHESPWSPPLAFVQVVYIVKTRHDEQRVTSTRDLAWDSVIIEPMEFR